MLEIRRNYNKSTTRGEASILSVSTVSGPSPAEVAAWQGQTKGVVNRFLCACRS